MKDVAFKSETDTEVIVQLIEKFVNEGMEVEEAFRQTLTLLEGSHAIALLDAENDETILVAKNKSPLLIGVGKDFNVVASDAMAMLQVTDQFLELMDKEMVIVTNGKGNDQEPFQQKKSCVLLTRLNWMQVILKKGTYPHYMLKEVDEQPAVIRKIIQAYKMKKLNLQSL